MSKSAADELETFLSVKQMWARPILPSKPFYKFLASDVCFGGSDLDGRVLAPHCFTQKSKRRDGGKGAGRGKGTRMALGRHIKERKEEARMEM